MTEVNLLGKVKPPQDSALVVVGTVSNVQRHLYSEVQRLLHALSDFLDVRWFLVESDSTDDTLRILEKCAEEVAGFHFKSLGNLADKIPQRTERLAHCRNTYLRALEHDENLQAANYVLVVDLDGMNTRLTAEAVRSCWDRTDWDACFANQDGPYYDIWALRHPIWSPNDCFQQHRFFRSHGLSRKVSYATAVSSRMITLRANSDWIRVDSAFGGLGIYRAEILRGKIYRGTDDYGDPLCEHVPLNQQLIQGGARLFINPALINSGTNEHSQALSREGSLIRQMMRAMHKVVKK